MHKYLAVETVPNQVIQAWAIYPLSLWERVRVRGFLQQIHIHTPLILTFSPGRRDSTNMPE
jgi:hypothetical protein